MESDSRSRNPFLGGNGRVPLVLAHRGASARETENTLAAFGRAMAEGADGVELDAMRCATGEIVVCHDEDLGRLAGRPERIDSLSLAALRQIRLRDGGEIPTLEEALAALGPTGLVNIEIKHVGFRPGGCRALVNAVVEAVQRTGAEHRVLVSSFSPAAVWLWRQQRPDVPCGLLWGSSRPWRRPWPLRMAWLLPLLSPFAVHPEASLCTPTAVAGWQRRGYAVNVWTVDDPARALALAALGVSAIITNEPQRTRAALAGLALTPRSGGG